jgi:ABC-type nickel/cobalt efflux system permease component RcnA
MGFSDTLPVLTSAVSLGLLHGVEPGHGWLVAAAFALRHPNRWWYGGWAAAILAFAHLTSSFAVVGLFVAADHIFDIGSYPWLHVLAGVLLILMAIHQWRSPGHHHGLARVESSTDAEAHAQPHAHPHAEAEAAPDTDAEDAHAHGRREPERVAAGSLLGLVGFAFALGFVHEEEFAVIALAAGRTNPWLVMLVYALAVAASLMALTLLSIWTLNRLERRLHRIEPWLPRASAFILAAVGIVYILGLV